MFYLAGQGILDFMQTECSKSCSQNPIWIRKITTMNNLISCIVCLCKNPCLHQQMSTNTEIAWRYFTLRKAVTYCIALPYACHSQSWECQPQKDSKPIVLCSARVNFFPTLVRYIIILSCDFSTFRLRCMSQNAGRAHVTHEFSLIPSMEYGHNTVEDVITDKGA
jgi:hypothetical protein